MADCIGGKRCVHQTAPCLTDARNHRLVRDANRFEPRTGQVDWTRVASVGVSRIEKEGDLAALRRFLPDVAVGRVDEDEVDAHPAMLKAFHLMQLQTQYILHCDQVRRASKQVLAGL